MATNHHHVLMFDNQQQSTEHNANQHRQPATTTTTTTTTTHPQATATSSSSSQPNHHQDDDDNENVQLTNYGVQVVHRAPQDSSESQSTSSASTSTGAPVDPTQHSCNNDNNSPNNQKIEENIAKNKAANLYQYYKTQNATAPSPAQEISQSRNSNINNINNNSNNNHNNSKRIITDQLLNVENLATRKSNLSTNGIQNNQNHHENHGNSKNIPFVTWSSPTASSASRWTILRKISLTRLTSSPSRLAAFIACSIALIIGIFFTAIFVAEYYLSARATCNTPECWREADRIIASLNRSVEPCDDFYEYVCGTWLRDTVIPEHKSSESRFDQLQDKVRDEMRAIIERPIDERVDADFVRKSKRFYQSCLNLSAIDAHGPRPLFDIIDKLGGWPLLSTTKGRNQTDGKETIIAYDDDDANDSFEPFDTSAYVELHRVLRSIGLLDDMIQSINVVSYDKNNTRNIIGISPPSFGLLDRDFMVREIVNDTSLQRYFRLMLYTVQLMRRHQNASTNDNLTMIGEEDDKIKLNFFDFENFSYEYNSTDGFDTVQFDADIELDEKAKAEMATVLEFEQILANNSMKKEDNRNLTLLFNNMTIADLEKMSPRIAWLELINVLSGRNLTRSEEIVVFDVNYIKFLDQFLTNTSMRIIRNYVIWRVVKTKIGVIGPEFRALRERYNAANFGNAKPEPRWRICVAQAQSNLGAAFSHLYVKSQFTSNDKDVINKIVLEIKEEFYQTLLSTEWMDEQTRRNGIEKLHSMQFRIGYPDEILVDQLLSTYYEELEVSDDYFQNILAMGRFATSSMFEQLNETNSRDDWRKFAEVVDTNAFYFHQDNAFTLNAGLLQGIFFNRNRPNYLNYGSIGEIIAHEITHGFDGLGKQFDPTGQLKNWWNHATARMFESKAACIVEQYGAYFAEEIDMYVNGVNTQDENIADNGGVGLAYRAYRKAYGRGSEPLLPALNFTASQLFWISYGIVNCEKMNNEMMRFNIQLDPHTPNRFRLNGVVSNSRDFAADFACAADAPMNPAKKCKIW